MQTPEERDKMLDIGRDGMIFCIDMDDSEGQHAVTQLHKLCTDVVHALSLRQNLRYVLVLIPYALSGRAITMMADRSILPDAIAKICKRSQDFGDAFSVIIVPAAAEIAAIFADVQTISGSA